jgi:ParB-like chromosome segregation protein Spo0J
MKIRDRIKDFVRVPASHLLPSPRNWRTHPKAQQDALRGVLAEIGFADALIARETPDGLELIDGHLRADVMGSEEVPVLVLDVTQDEADKILATLDPLAAMASADDERLAILMDSARFDSEPVNAMLEALIGQEFSSDFGEYPDLPEGDKSDIGQMTFTVTEAQRSIIHDALTLAKRQEGAAATGNENSNGNALASICEAYANG